MRYGILHSRCGGAGVVRRLSARGDATQTGAQGGMAGRVSMIIEARNAYVVYDAETRDSHCKCNKEDAWAGRVPPLPPFLSFSLCLSLFAPQIIGLNSLRYI